MVAVISHIDLQRLTELPDHNISTRVAPIRNPPSSQNSIRTASAYSGDTALQGFDDSSFLTTYENVHEATLDHNIDPLLLSKPHTPINSPVFTPPPPENGHTGASGLFCMHCRERDEMVTFKAKHDWKRHVKNKHETNLEFQCQEQGCIRICECEQDIRKHYSKAHKIPVPRIIGTPVSGKQVYACGRVCCGNLENNFKDWCDHVAKCMKKPNGQWTYSCRMQNLLWHESINPTWQRTIHRHLPGLGIESVDLLWNPMASWNQMRRLECLSFGSSKDLEDLLLQVLKLGLSHSISPFYTEPTGSVVSSPRHRQNSHSSNQFLGNVPRTETISGFTLVTSPSASDHTGVAPSRISHGGSPSRSQRNSVVMHDVLESPTEYAATSSAYSMGSTSDDGKMTVNEFILSDSASHRPTPPVPQTPFPATQHLHRTSPKRHNLMRKSMDLLRPCRSTQPPNHAENSLVRPNASPKKNHTYLNGTPNAYSYHL
ncbi:hypothetical protein B0J11DRAFT_54961 [Dendryphion nanum]|uniref:C2H2-type domain-containing protein n=1 Tax=Dendryphion nanum TaxID=256645 RepID=A0A9P9IGE9_9PLEO|nr:hypothetical protein B0J11DRAFT_54961 [Dendryphion nanum]